MSPTAVRHAAPVAARARELREAGWQLREVQRLLDSEFGVRPSRDTISRWCDPGYAAKVAERIRARNRRVWAQRWEFRLAGARHSKEYREAFIRRLDAEGVSIPDIARVYGVVFGERVTKHQVAWLLRTDPR